jgi:hypothetical protein
MVLDFHKPGTEEYMFRKEDEKYCLTSIFKTSEIKCQVSLIKLHEESF